MVSITHLDRGNDDARVYDERHGSGS
jgi:hypothetical protein